MIRELIWKLADQTLVFADWRGFSDAALPGNRPAGLLRWCSRMVMTTGLSDAWWWVPYFVLVAALAASVFILLPLRLRSGAKRGFAAAAACLAVSALYAFVPVVATGDFVWDESESSFPVMGLLGALVSVGIFAALRSLVRRSPWGIVLSLFACVLLFIPFGAYSLLALAALVAWSLCSRELRSEWSLRVPLCAFAVVAAVPAACLRSRIAYDDLAPSVALESSHAFRLRWNPCGPWLARQLRMERAVIERDWRGVLEATGQSGGAPKRMETALTILAQYRMARLPDDLFKYEIVSPHANTASDQRTMDGYLLFLEYGLLQQARCYAMELVTKRGWRPGYFAALGDVALLQGLSAEARRHYSQLARVPFRASYADERLKCLASGVVVPFDLVDCAAMAKALDAQVESDNDFVLFNLDSRVESHVYSRYARLRNAPDFMMKMHLAAKLLECETESLASEAPLLDRLYPQRWPVPVQEALLVHAGRLDAAAQANYLKGVRPGVVERATFERMSRYSADRAKLGAAPSRADVERMWREYSGTYPIYEWLVAGR